MSDSDIKKGCVSRRLFMSTTLAGGAALAATNVSAGPVTGSSKGPRTPEEEILFRYGGELGGTKEL